MAIDCGRWKLCEQFHIDFNFLEVDVRHPELARKRFQNGIFCDDPHLDQRLINPVLTLLAATVYKAREAGPLMLEEYGWLPMIIGSVAAWISAVVAIKWMVAYLKNHGMAIFGYYRIAIAILVAALILTGTIDANTPH